jgi:hypothetical protein
MDQFQVDMCSLNSLNLYPDNKGCDFWIGLDETLLLRNGRLRVALVSLTVECGRDVGAYLKGQDLYLCSNVVDLSLLGGKNVIFYGKSI